MVAVRRRDRLRNIRTFASLIRFLREELDWPIQTADFEELTFEYDPEELGIDAVNAAKIVEIKRLRPLVHSQPWGIFFVNFEPKRLPVVALRRILAGVVTKKRATSSSAEQRKWLEDDLLFISSYGQGQERRISFAHFSSDRDRNHLPTLKVIAWDELDTPLHLEHTADVLVNRLAWPPTDDVSDIQHWRDRWASAFELRHREVISTSKALAERLAVLARRLRDEIRRVSEVENEDGNVTRLMNTFRQVLVHEMDPDDFADMYAQTIACGLLSARIAEPAKRTVDDFAGHMRTNPFIRELMETFLRIGGQPAEVRAGLDFDELGVTEVINLLDAANMDAILRDFGDRNPLEDPVMHFYELFLANYDPDKRLKRGVFYTPRPIAAAMVRRVHKILTEERGIAYGLADPSVSILDPAVGTGTFLVEAIGLIHRTLMEKWHTEGAAAADIRDKWNDYVPRLLLPRLYGFEIMMAPYAIAHLKIGLKLHETGYDFGSRARVNVILTDSLQPKGRAVEQFELVVPAMAHEARAALAAKKHSFSVVIGNPPYRNNSDLTLAQVSSRFPRLLESSRLAARAQERNIRDDYAWFYAAADAYADEQSGIVSLVTSDSYARIGSYRFLREQILRRYSVCGLVLLGRSVFREVSPRISFAILELLVREGVSRHEASNRIEVTDVRMLADDVRASALATAEDPRLQLLGDVAAGHGSMPAPVTHETTAERRWSFFPPGEGLLDRVGADSLPIFTKGGDRLFVKKWPGIITAFDDLLKARDSSELAERMRTFFDACYAPQAIRSSVLAEWAAAHGISDRWTDRIEYIAADMVSKGVRFSASSIKRSVSGSIPNELKWWPPPTYRHYVYYEPRIKIPRNVNVGKAQGWGSMEQWREPEAHLMTPKLIFTTTTNPRSGYKAFVVDDEWYVKLHGGTSQQYNFTGLHAGGHADLLEDRHANLTSDGRRALATLQSFGLDESALLHLIAAIYNSSLAARVLERQSGEELRVRLPSEASMDTCLELVGSARRLRALHQLLYDGESQDHPGSLDGIVGFRKVDGRVVLPPVRDGDDSIKDELDHCITREQSVLDDLVASYYEADLE